MMPTPHQMLTMMGAIRDNLLVIEERNGSRFTPDAITNNAYDAIRQALDEFHDPIAEEARNANRRDPAKALFTANLPFTGSFHDFNRMDIEVGQTVRIHESASRMDYGEGVVIGIGSLTDSTNASVYVRFEDDERLGEFTPGQVIVMREAEQQPAVVDQIASVIYNRGLELTINAEGGTGSFDYKLGHEFMLLADILTGDAN
jgi:hypothetical protein